MWCGSNTHLFYPADTAYVRVFVTDVNDNAPAFSQSVYEISVEEDKEVGFVVITVTANDEDEGNLLLYVGMSDILFRWSCHLSLVCVFCCFSFVCLCNDFFLTAHWYFWQRWRRRGCKKKLSEINLGGKFTPFFLLSLLANLCGECGSNNFSNPFDVCLFDLFFFAVFKKKN